MKKRIISFLLAVVMVLALLPIKPITAYALVHDPNSEYITDGYFDWKDLKVTVDNTGKITEISAAAWYNYSDAGAISGRKYGFYIVKSSEDKVAQTWDRTNIPVEDFDALMEGVGKRINIGTAGSDRKWMSFSLTGTDCEGMTSDDEYDIWFWTSDGGNFYNSFESKMGTITSITINRYTKATVGYSGATTDYSFVDTTKTMNIVGQKLDSSWKTYNTLTLNTTISNQNDLAKSFSVYNLYFYPAHKLSPVDGLDPTEFDPGYKSCYRCTECLKYCEDAEGKVEIDDIAVWRAKGGNGYIAPLGHKLSPVDGLDPTEFDPGYKSYYQCERCKEYFEDADAKTAIADLDKWKAEGGNGYLAPLGHSLTPVDGLDPTEFDPGYKSCYQCTGCNKYCEDADGKTEIDDIDVWRAEGGNGYLAPLGHKISPVDGLDPTEFDPGYKNYYQCERCKECFEDADGKTAIADIDMWKAEGGNGYIAPIGHKLSPVDGQDPTEFDPGFKSYYQCERCKEYFEDADAKTAIADLDKWKAEGGNGYIAPLGHKLSPVDGQDPTEFDPGFKSYYQCERCKEYFEDADAKTAIADLDKWKAKGGNGYLAPLGHKLSPVDGLDPTELEPGFKSYYQCAGCKKYFEDANGKTEIPDIEKWKAKGGNGYLPALYSAPDTGNSTFVGLGFAMMTLSLLALTFGKRRKNKF